MFEALELYKVNKILPDMYESIADYKDENSMEHILANINKSKEDLISIEATEILKVYNSNKQFEILDENTSISKTEAFDDALTNYLLTHPNAYYY